jgi:putative transposase
MRFRNPGPGWRLPTGLPGTALAGPYIGIRGVADGIWIVSFMNYDSGFFEQQDNRVRRVGYNPFDPKLLPMYPE